MNTFTYNKSFRNELKEDAHSYGEVTFLETHAETGMTALDIGANKGLSTVAMAQKIGSSGTVYAFEPVPGDELRGVHAYLCLAWGQT